VRRSDTEVIVAIPCQLPEGTPADVTVSAQSRVATLRGVDVKTLQPGVLEVLDDASGMKFAQAIHPDGTPVSPASPAVRGEVLRIFATGLGPIVEPASADSTETALKNIDTTLGINDVGVPLLRSGYLLTMPGTCYVELAVPSDFGEDITGLRFVIGERPGADTEMVYSNTAIIPVRSGS
jgi:uncharacterized protein (TIGR03437 family)